MFHRPHTRWLWRLILVAGLALTVLLPTAALAQEGNYPPSTTTPTTTKTCTDPAVCSTVGGSSATNSLPFTGGDVALLTVLGLGVAAGGLGLVWVGRRRSQSPA